MRNLKRALSLALASVMLVGMMVVGTSAASYPDVDSEDHVEAIEVLSAVGVIVGDNGNFRPDDKVSRNEMAVIMAKLILGTYEADSYVGSHPFTDVPDWASKYVAACYNSGIIAGRSETTYDGAATVTAVEAAAMMLRALGYEDLSKGAAQWDQPVAAKANEINLFESLSGSSQTPMDRNSVAQLALNTLEATMVTTSRGAQDITLPDGTTITGTRNYNDRYTSTLDYTKSEGKFVADGEGKSTDEKLQLCEHLYGTDLRKATGADDDFGRPATKWRYDSKDVITVADSASASYTKEVKHSTIYKDLGLSGASKPATVITDGDSDNSTAVTLAKSGANGDAKLGGNGVLVEAYKDSDGDVTICVINTYLVKVDGDYSTKNERLNVKNIDGANAALPAGTSVRLSSEDFAGLDAYKDGDYVLVTVANKTIKTIEAAPSVTGSVSSYSGTSNVTVDGTRRSYSAKHGTIPSYELGEDYDLYLDKSDYVLFAEKVEDENKNYVFVTDYANKSGLGDAKFDATVYFTDGTSENIVVSKQDKTWANNESGDTKTGKLGWCSYTKKSNGDYELKAVSGAKFTGTADKFANTDVITTKGAVTVTFKSSSNNTVSANNNTVFIVYDKPLTGDAKVSVYNGIRNVPTIKATGTDEVVGVIMNKAGTTAEYVFIMGTQLTVEGGSTSDRVFILDAGQTRKDEAGDEVHVYKAIYNGEFQEVTSIDYPMSVGLYQNPTLNSKDYITGATLIDDADNIGNEDAMAAYAVIGGIEIDGGVLDIKGAKLTTAEKVKIMVRDTDLDDKGEEITEAELNNTYNEGQKMMVYVVKEDKLITEIYLAPGEYTAPSAGIDPDDVQDFDALEDGDTVLGATDGSDNDKIEQILGVTDVADGGNVVCVFTTTASPQKVILEISKGGVVQYSEWATFVSAGKQHFYVNLNGRNGVGNAKADANDATVKANASGKFGANWIFTGSEGTGWTPGTGSGTGNFTWTVKVVEEDGSRGATLTSGSFTVS